MKDMIRCVLAGIFSVLLIPAAFADITLTDRNTQVLIDPVSQAGMHSWTVDGINQLSQQWFWYRLDEQPTRSAQFSIDTISAPNVVMNGPNRVTITYANAMFNVEIDYVLHGGAPNSGTADMAEIISINNLTERPFTIHFFQYSDFDLNGGPGNQTARIPGPAHNTALQSGNGSFLSETVVTGSPDHWEANVFNNTLNALNGGIYTLNDNETAFGNATWAFEWDRVIAGNDTFIISKDKHIAIPAPAAVGLCLLGFSFVGWVRRRF